MGKRKTFLALLAFGGMLASGCLDTGTSPDGTEVPSDWEPYPVEAGTTIRLFGQVDEVGGPWAFEINWGSPGNDLSFVIYEQTGACAVPTPLEADSSLPTCPVAVGDRSRAKPKRVDWIAEPGSTHVLTVTNNGPGDETAMVREIRFE